MEQLTLNFRHNENHLKGLFEKAAGRPIALTLTDNSTSLLSVKSKNETVSVRLHRMFLEAGSDVICEIADFIRKRRGETPLIRGFIKERRHCLKKSTCKRLNARTLGRHYDLGSIYESVNKAYFEGSITAVITWGTKSPRRAVRRRTLGSFSSHSNTIRINPILDNERVPDYFIEFIVYHEMLHAHIGVQKKNGRRSVHSREFKEREKMFRDYEKAMIWERRNRI